MLFPFATGRRQINTLSGMRMVIPFTNSCPTMRFATSLMMSSRHATGKRGTVTRAGRTETGIVDNISKSAVPGTECSQKRKALSHRTSDAICRGEEGMSGEWSCFPVAGAWRWKSSDSFLCIQSIPSIFRFWILFFRKVVCFGIESPLVGFPRFGRDGATPWQPGSVLVTYKAYVQSWLQIDKNGSR